jgi:hypothetical protein
MALQPLDELVQIFNFDLKPVPSPRLGGPPGGAGSACARGGEEQTKVTFGQRRKSGCGMHLHLETKTVAIELDGVVDVFCDVSNTHSHFTVSLSGIAESLPGARAIRNPPDPGETPDRDLQKLS